MAGPGAAPVAPVPAARPAQGPPSLRPGRPNNPEHNARTQTQSDSSKSELDTFFTNMGAVATLGASITFVLIISQLQDPLQTANTKSLFTVTAVRVLLAISWLLFTIVLVASFYIATLVERPATDSHGDRLGYNYILAFFLYVPMTGAFVCLSLAVMAYVFVVGVIAVALVGLFWLIMALLACFNFARFLGTAGSAGIRDDD